MPSCFGRRAFFDPSMPWISFLAAASRGSQRPTCLQNFLPFSDTEELTAARPRFCPIPRIKACLSVWKQELAREYFDIDPRSSPREQFADGEESPDDSRTERGWRFADGTYNTSGCFRTRWILFFRGIWSYQYSG